MRVPLVTRVSMPRGWPEIRQSRWQQKALEIVGSSRKIIYYRPFQSFSYLNSPVFDVSFGNLDRRRYRHHHHHHRRLEIFYLNARRFDLRRDRSLIPELCATVTNRRVRLHHQCLCHYRRLHYSYLGPPYRHSHRC